MGHLRQCSIMSIGEKAGKAKTTSSRFNNLPRDCTLEDVYLPARALTVGCHADCRCRLVLPVFNHSVDSLRADCFNEPLDVRAGKTVEGVDAVEGEVEV